MESLKLQNSIMDNSKVLQIPDLLHGIRVAKLVALICREMQISGKEREEIIISAALHDIGKSMVDREILNKPGKLNNMEWQFMKLHPEFGAAIASKMKLGSNICKNILYHHEDYNGEGYPKRIKGSDIPLGASIIRICDSYDAMRTTRSYKKGFTHDEAVNELLKTRDKYNPSLLNVFLKLDLEKEKLY